MIDSGGTPLQSPQKGSKVLLPIIQSPPIMTWSTIMDLIRNIRRKIFCEIVIIWSQAQSPVLGEIKLAMNDLKKNLQFLPKYLRMCNIHSYI